MIVADLPAAELAAGGRPGFPGHARRRGEAPGARSREKIVDAGLNGHARDLGVGARIPGIAGVQTGIKAVPKDWRRNVFRRALAHQVFRDGRLARKLGGERVAGVIDDESEIGPVSVLPPRDVGKILAELQGQRLPERRPRERRVRPQAPAERLYPELVGFARERPLVHAASPGAENIRLDGGLGAQGRDGCGAREFGAQRDAPVGVNSARREARDRVGAVKHQIFRNRKRLAETRLGSSSEGEMELLGQIQIDSALQSELVEVWGRIPAATAPRR